MRELFDIQNILLHKSIVIKKGRPQANVDSKGLDQTAHLRSLIRACAVRLMGAVNALDAVKDIE